VFTSFYGNVLSEKTGDGSVAYTAYQYDETGRFAIEVDDLVEYTSSTATYDGKFGTILSSTDYLGRTTTASYDGQGRQTKVNSPEGISTTTSYLWDLNGATGSLIKVNSSNSFGSSGVYYDAVGKKLKSYSTGFNGSIAYTDYQYNVLGQVTHQSLAHYEGETPVWDDYTYDPSTANLQAIDAGIHVGMVTTGNTSTITGPDGSVIKNYNDIGQLTSINESNLGNNTISYEYSPWGEPTKITTAVGTISMEYDVNGNRTMMTETGISTVNNTYDSYSRPLDETQTIAGTTVKTSNTYLGDKLTKVSATEGVTNYSYYPNGNLQSVDNPIVQSIIKDVNGTILQPLNAGKVIDSYQYDSYDRINLITRSIDDRTYTNSMSYDNLGRVLSVSYPSGFSVSYIYNDQGQMSELHNSNTGALLWKLNTTNAMGQVTQSTAGNGLVTNRTYDGRGRITGISTDAIQMAVGYEYDQTSGNLNARTYPYSHIRESFGYDNSRLHTITSTTGQSQTVNYDNAGNIANKSDAGSYEYNNTAQPYAVSDIVPSQSSAISSTTQHITYTSFGKVATIQEGTTKRYEITYGPDGQRVKAVYSNNGQPEWIRYYFGSYERFIDLVSGNTYEIVYVRAAGTIVAMNVRQNSTNNTTYFLMCDHLGSPMAVTDSKSTIIATYGFDAWGRRRNPNSLQAYTAYNYSNYNKLPWFNRGYTGHEMLDEVNLINMNGRVYDPYVGRFLSPDNFIQSESNSQSYNRYSYCKNSPLMYTDPDGEFWQIIIGATIGGVVNLAMNWNHVHSFWDGLGYFGVGAAAGAFMGLGSSCFAGTVLMSAGAGGFANSMNAGMATNWNGVAMGQSLFVGLAAGAVGGAAGGYASNLVNVGGFEGGLVAGATGGFAGGVTGGLLTGQNFGESLLTGLKGAAFGGAIGGVAGGTIAGLEGRNFMNGLDYRINPVGETSIATKAEFKKALEKANNYNKSNDASKDTEVLKGRMQDCYGVTEENTNIKITTKPSDNIGLTDDNKYVTKYYGKYYKMPGYTLGDDYHISPYTTYSDEVLFDAFAGHEYMHIQQYNNYGQNGISERDAYRYTYNTLEVAGYVSEMNLIKQTMINFKYW
jgi:RHS repeat-associated protein